MGFQGLFRAAGIVFFSFIGFDGVSCLAEECKNPRKDMVLGIIGTLSIATSIYVGVSVVLTGMVPFTALDKNAPLAVAFQQHDQVFSTLYMYLMYPCVLCVLCVLCYAVGVGVCALS